MVMAEGPEYLGGPPCVAVAQDLVVGAGEVSRGSFTLEVLEGVQEEGAFVVELGPGHGPRTPSEAPRTAAARSAIAR